MRCVIVVGSNSGQREETIGRSLRFLEDNGSIRKKSAIYETLDCLGKGPGYLNCVLELETAIEEDILLRRIKEFEAMCGRTAQKKEKGEVEIDIDIVVWEREVRRSEDFKAHYFREGFHQIAGIENI